MSVHVFVFGARGLSAPLSGAALASWLIPGSRLPPQKERPFTQRPTSAASPRCPDDCPACLLASTPSAVVEPVPLPVRPWREVKSRRGAPKRVNTAGFACPNQQCSYFGISDAQIHALVGDGKHGKAECIQTFRCQACRTTFTARRNTPLYRLKPPSQQVAVVRIARWPRGWIRSRGLAGLWLSTSHDHHLVDSRWRTCTDVAQAVLLPSAPATHPAGRTPHQAAQPYAGAVALASHRSSHQDSACA